jgi:hypothetical protein
LTVKNKSSSTARTFLDSIEAGNPDVTMQK